MWFVSARPINEEGELSSANEITQDQLILGKLIDSKKVLPQKINTWLAELTDCPNKHIIFYLHGFNNPPYKKVVRRVRNIQAQVKKSGIDSFVVVPIFWPTQQDSMPVNNYYQDQQWADLTAQLIHKYLLPLTEKITNHSIHFIAHSMGARVLLNSLKNTHYRHFSQLFLIAPDVVNEILEVGQPGEIFSQSFKQVTLFYANDDLALTTSVIANVANKVLSRRLGQSGPENIDLLPENVTAIDCSDINYSTDSVKGHSYFVSKHKEITPVIKTICDVIMQTK